MIIKILFTILLLTVGHEAYREDDDLMNMITAMIVSIPLYFMWLY